MSLLRLLVSLGALGWSSPGGGDCGNIWGGPRTAFIGVIGVIRRRYDSFLFTCWKLFDCERCAVTESGFHIRDRLILMPNSFPEVKVFMKNTKIRNTKCSLHSLFLIFIRFLFSLIYLKQHKHWMIFHFCSS